MPLHFTAVHDFSISRPHYILYSTIHHDNLILNCHSHYEYNLKTKLRYQNAASKELNWGCIDGLASLN